MTLRVCVCLVPKPMLHIPKHDSLTLNLPTAYSVGVCGCSFLVALHTLQAHSGVSVCGSARIPLHAKQSREVFRIYRLPPEMMEQRVPIKCNDPFNCTGTCSVAHRPKCFRRTVKECGVNSVAMGYYCMHSAGKHPLPGSGRTNTQCPYAFRMPV